MIIANPIYDVVFKLMMENEKIASFFIGTLLDEQIEKLEVKPQELAFKDKEGNPLGIALIRFDFVATIKTSTGKFKKVLIEIQKAWDLIDLVRFRNYLAEQYKKVDEIDGQSQSLPITTIYILGFKLPEIKSPCIKVSRDYIDLIKKEPISERSDFVEKLTHDSYVVQVGRITERYQTKLDKLLSVFEQAHFVGDNEKVKEFKHDPELPEIKLMTEVLHYACTDPEEREKIDLEAEAWRTIHAHSEPYRKGMEVQKQMLERQEKVVEEMAKQMEELKRRLGEK
jgi:hypothetical protein